MPRRRCVTHLPCADEQVKREVVHPAGEQERRILEEARDVGQRSEPPIGADEVQAHQCEVEPPSTAGSSTAGMNPLAHRQPGRRRVRPSLAERRHSLWRKVSPATCLRSCVKWVSMPILSLAGRGFNAGAYGSRGCAALRRSTAYGFFCPCFDGRERASRAGECGARLRCDGFSGRDRGG